MQDNMADDGATVQVTKTLQDNAVYTIDEQRDAQDEAIIALGPIGEVMQAVVVDTDRAKKKFTETAVELNKMAQNVADTNEDSSNGSLCKIVAVVGFSVTLAFLVLDQVL